jgi:spore germination protein YaaH
VKGDNPVTIARHLHVDYAALLELNQITDPRKLQIGTKVHIPEREESAKGKSD